MNNTLSLGRELLVGDPERLRRLLVDHTESEHAATELLLAVERARQDGDVSRGFLYPRAEPGETRWKMRFSYDAW